MSEPVTTWRMMLQLQQDELAEIAEGTAKRPYLPAEIEAKRQEALRLQALIEAHEAASDA